MIPLNKPSFTDLESVYVADALASGWVTTGPYVERFEAQIAKMTWRKYAVAVSSGTSALYLALRALGDVRRPVLLPAYTCDAVCNAAIMADYPIRIHDAEPDTFGMRAPLSYSEYGAVVLAHAYGVPARDSAFIAKNCVSPVLIEDASEAHGAWYDDGQPVGKLGTVSIMSFRGEKTVSGGQLGVVLTDDEEIARGVHQWAHNGLPADKVRFWATKPGLNMQPSHLNAALACAQLERLPELVDKRNKVHAGWIDAFKLVGSAKGLFQQNGPHTPAWWLTAIRTDKFTKMLPQDIGLALDAKGIQTRPGFYPLNYLPHVRRYQGASVESQETPIADYLLRNLLILPSGPDITPEEQAATIKAIGEVTGAW